MRQHVLGMSVLACSTYDLTELGKLTLFPLDASRFLAQSQSRISSFRQPQPDSTSNISREPSDRQQRRTTRASRFPPSRSYLQRPASSNPYAAAASQLVPFPFASRPSAAPSAPLFYSATDDFREEDDEAEREREVADLYALQRSRRQFGASRLEESSEADDDDGSGSSDLGPDGGRTRGFGLGGGIKSSWKGDKADRDRRKKATKREERSRHDHDDDGDQGKEPMVDVRLESSTGRIAEALEDDVVSTTQGLNYWRPELSG